MSPVKAISLAWTRVCYATDHVYNPVQCIPLAAIVQKEDVSNDFRHNSLGRTSANAIDDTCAHEGTVRVSFGAPDASTEVDELTEQVHRSTAEGGTDGDPRACQYDNSSELHNGN